MDKNLILNAAAAYKLKVLPETDDGHREFITFYDCYKIEIVGSKYSISKHLETDIRKHDEADLKAATSFIQDLISIKEIKA